MGIDVDRPVEDAREKLGDVRIVTPSVPGGRKGFTAALRPEKRGFFKMNPRGFGLLGKGVQYYAPTSTVALLAYLLGRRPDDAEYACALTATAKFVGRAAAQGTIGITTSAHVAMEAAAAGWACAMEGDRQKEDGVVESKFDEEQRRVIEEGARLAAQQGVDIFELSNALVDGLASARPPDSDPGVVWAFPIEAVRGQCSLEFVTAAMIDDLRLDEAFRHADSSDDLRQVALRVLEDRGLTRVVDAMVLLISADDVESAL